MDVVITVNEDFIGSPWVYYCHLHRLVQEFKRKGHSVYAVGPGISRYQIMDSQAVVNKIFEFEETAPGYFCLNESSIDPHQHRLGDLLFIHGYDETNENLAKVDPFQTNFLRLFSDRFHSVVNTPDSELYTLKNNNSGLERKVEVPFVPTSQFQEKEQLMDYIAGHQHIVAKPYNQACSIGFEVLSSGSPHLEDVVDSIDLTKYVFQPQLHFEREKQVFFVEGHAVGATEKRYRPWDRDPDYDDYPSQITNFDRRAVHQITKATGLKIGRIDILYLDEPWMGRDRYILEVNGSGSGQVFVNGDEENGFVTVADYTGQIVSYCETLVPEIRSVIIVS